MRRSCLLVTTVVASAWSVAWPIAVAWAAAPEDQRTVDIDARRALSGVWVLNERLSDDVIKEDAVRTLVIRLTTDSVTFYQPDGSRHVYHLSGKRERQTLGAAVVWTTAVFDGAKLRVQFEGAGSLRVQQSFFFDRRTRHLIVTTSLDRHSAPSRAIGLVYEALIDNSP
jgi:hypothetical protein